MTHGLSTTYTHRACRCRPCTVAHMTAVRTWRQRTGRTGPRYVPLERITPILQWALSIAGTQEGAAEILGVSQPAISNWLRGRRRVMRSSGLRLVAAVRAYEAQLREEARREHQAAERKYYRDRAKATA